MYWDAGRLALRTRSGILSTPGELSLPTHLHVAPQDMWQEGGVPR